MHGVCVQIFDEYASTFVQRIFYLSRLSFEMDSYRCDNNAIR